MGWLLHLRCWLFFGHHMEKLGKVNGHVMWQCEICAYTISVNQFNMKWL